MDTGFKKYHPISNLIFFVSVIFFALSFKHPITVAVCFIAASSYYTMLCKKKALKTIFCFIIPMMLFVVVFNSMFSHYGITPLYTLKNGNQITLESIIYGLILGIITVTLIMIFFCYNEVMTTDKFLHIFGKILPSFALIISMTLRFIPLFSKRLKEINEVQSCFNSQSKSLISKIKAASKNVSILITWSLEKAIETSDSMKSRGYGLKNRKNYSKYRLTKNDIIFILVVFILDLFLIHGLATKAIFCFYNPYILIASLTANGIITICTFVILCFLPIIVQIKEEIKWLRLKSKI